MAKNQKTSSVYIDGKQAGNTLADLRKAARDLNKEINQMKPGTDEYRKAVAQLGSVNGELQKHSEEVRKVSGAYGEVKNSLGGVKNLIGAALGAAGVVAAVGMVVKGITGWITKNKDLEKSLSSLQALTNASTEDLKFYKQEAIEMGKSTTQSATQVINAMKLVGSSKPELLANRQALAQVTRETITLAEAAEMEMGPAAQALTGILNQFNLTAGESPRIINSLAAGSQAGAANIESLSQTIDKAGATLKGYNVSVEQSIAMAETLAEKNIMGAEAGTALRNVMLKMQTIEALPEKAIHALEQYGVNTKLIADETVPFNERLQEMSKIAHDATAMMQVFGTENVTAAAAIFQNTDKVKKYTEAVTDTNTAYEQAAINNDNLDGDLKSLSSAWEGLNLTLSGSNGILRVVVQNVTELLNWITDTINAFANWDVNAIQTAFLKLGSAILSLIDPFGWFTGGIRDSIAEQIRLNELTGQVIDKIQDQSRSLKILTSALGDNNEALKAGNLTQEEENRLKAENAKIIETLTDKYPEFTEEIDLQSASLEELSEWQNQVTDNILKQAIEEVKADFNPAKNDLVDQIKNKSAELIDLVEKLRTQDGIGNANDILSCEKKTTDKHFSRGYRNSVYVCC